MSLLAAINSAIINADSYKVSHWPQYPEGTEYVSSYIEARSSQFARDYGAQYDFAEFFGLQAYIKEYLTTPVTQDDVDLGAILFRMHGEPFNKEGWQHIVDHHGGKLPIEIRALAEGTVLPTSNAMVEIVNTDPKCFWLTSYVETALLRAVWYPTTVATKSRVMKEFLREYLDETSDNSDAVIDFMLHDFGARGVSSLESSSLAGMAHLVNFKGTDTVMGIVGALSYYEPEYDRFLAETPDRPKRALIRLLEKMEADGTPLPGFSVEASEHSTMTIKGKEGEKEQIKMLIDRAKTGKIVSIVSDSYDYFNNLTNVYGGDFKEDILEAGRNGGRVVIRPDSGDPVDVIIKSLKILDEKFGCTVNKKGYKVLPPCVRVLQGDGIDIDSLKNILKAIKENGYAAENLVFGMGGGLEQKVNRDLLNFAQKASWASIKGVEHDIFKNPATAALEFVKKSKKGRLSTVFDGVAFKTKRTLDLLKGEADMMVPVFRDGAALNLQSFSGIRAKAKYFVELLRQKSVAPVQTNPKQTRPAP
ncbi:MAG: nicotinate phosphoribosyltransferase [Proteobacteria bacterium]|nr:nicotinate phosphoribosyltransferase [Pseudomonadota bacterium]